MSLANLLIRNLSIMALTGRTLAKSEVRGSLLLPLNEIKPEEIVPVIAVFTDTAKSTLEQIEGRDFIGAQSTATLAFEFACFTRAPIAAGVDGSDTTTVLGIPDTDEGMEMTLDIIGHQIFSVLQAGDNPWSTIWRDFVVRGRGWEAVRGASVEGGSKFAARRLEMMVQPICDPIAGRPLAPIWESAIAAFEGNAPTATLGAMLRKVATGSPLPEWRTIQDDLGMTRDGFDAIGLGPMATADNGGAVPVAHVTIEDQDRTEDLVVELSQSDG